MDMEDWKRLAADAAWSNGVIPGAVATSHWALNRSTLDIDECTCSIGHDH